MNQKDEINIPFNGTENYLTCKEEELNVPNNKWHHIKLIKTPFRDSYSINGKRIFDPNYFKNWKLAPLTALINHIYKA